MWHNLHHEYREGRLSISVEWQYLPRHVQEFYGTACKYTYIIHHKNRVELLIFLLLL